MHCTCYPKYCTGLFERLIHLDRIYLFLKQNFSVEDQKQLDNRWTSFPETLEVEGKQDQLFPVGSVTKCFVITPNWKLKKLHKDYFLDTCWHNKFVTFSRCIHLTWSCSAVWQPVLGFYYQYLVQFVDITESERVQIKIVFVVVELEAWVVVSLRS